MPTPTPSRAEVKSRGTRAGRIRCRNMPRRPSPSDLAASRRFGGISATPSRSATMVWKIATVTTKSIFELSPMPSVIMNTGRNAIFGAG